MKNLLDCSFFEIKLKKALDVPISNMERKAVKLANRNDKIPKSWGPKPRAINRPVAKESTAFITLDIRENNARLVGFKILKSLSE